MKKWQKALGGFAVGLANGLFGAGGGMITVPLLKKAGDTQKEAQANAISVILPLSALSVILYTVRGHADLSAALPYLPAGLLGAWLGTGLLKKFSPRLLRRVFALLMIWAGVRLILR